MKLFRASLKQDLCCGVLLYLLTLSLSSIVHGQVIISGKAAQKSEDEPKPAAYQVANARVTVEEMTDGVGQIYRMKISPAAEPSPVFKHRFCVPPRKTIPANAATMYLRSFGEGSLRRPIDAAYEEYGDAFYDWQSIEEVPVEALLNTPAQKVSQTFDKYIDSHITRATYSRYCDWGLAEEDLTGLETMEFLLPSVQETRSISRVLALQTRVAIAEKRYDRAAELIRMNYQLGRNVAKMRFLVSSLVAIAEVGITNGTMIDMVAAPDSPNMYYALTELPRPIINTRDSFRMEMTVMETLFPELFEAEKTDLSVEVWREKAASFAKSYFDMYKAMFDGVPEDKSAAVAANMQKEPSPSELGFRLTPAALSIFAYGPAKQQLIGDGDDQEKIEAMPVAQVIAIAAARSIRERSNDNERWIYQPFHVAVRGFEQEERAMNAAEAISNGLANPGDIITSMLLPASQQVFQAHMRLQRDVDALRVIEAIRMHAAQTGVLPATLDEISVVPVPVNPATNKPFSYKLKAGTATLDLPSSDGIVYSKRFELRL